MAEPESKYSAEEMKGDAVGKKDLLTFLQESSSNEFLVERKLMGKVANVVKTKSKDDLIQFYNELFETKKFRAVDEVFDKAAAAAKLETATQRVKKLSVSDEPKVVRYTKKIMKKGNDQKPSKGDFVSVWYTGKLDDGTVFDTNTTAPRRGKKPEVLRVKVGYGHLIKGWDEALLTMHVGEKAELVIESDWAYGKKGLEGKIPPNSRLTFQVELVTYA